MSVPLLMTFPNAINRAPQAVLAEPHNAVKVSTACPSSLRLFPLPLFMYRCPNTGYRVQGFVAEDTSEDGHVYEPVTFYVIRYIT